MLKNYLEIFKNKDVNKYSDRQIKQNLNLCKGFKIEGLKSHVKNFKIS